MKSPFPGMDPYLEQHWRDVHHVLITYARDQLRPTLPRDLRPRIEERGFIESDEGEPHEIYPDVHVVEYPKKEAGEGQPAESAAVAVAEPILVHVDREPSSQGYIEIVDVGSGNRVITVIEFVSPTNKLPGKGRKALPQEAKRSNRRWGEPGRDRSDSLRQAIVGRADGTASPLATATYMACVTRVEA